MHSIRDVEQIILKNELLLKQAIINADSEMLDKLLDESLDFTIRGVKISKEDYIDADKKNLHKLYSSETFLQVFRKIEVDIVNIELWVDMKGRFNGVDIAGKYKYTHIWKLKNNEYKLVLGKIDREEESKLPN